MNAATMQPVVIKVSDILEIKARRRTSGSGEYITVPKQYVYRLLASDKVRVRCNGVYTDDYAFDNDVNYRIGEVPADAMLADLNRWQPRNLTANYRPAWTDIHGKIRPASIDFRRHMNEGYSIYPVDGQIVVEAR